VLRVAWSCLLLFLFNVWTKLEINCTAMSYLLHCKWPSAQNLCGHCNTQNLWQFFESSSVEKLVQYTEHTMVSSTVVIYFCIIVHKFVLIFLLNIWDLNICITHGIPLYILFHSFQLIWVLLLSNEIVGIYAYSALLIVSLIELVFSLVLLLINSDDKEIKYPVIVYWLECSIFWRLHL